MATTVPCIKGKMGNTTFYETKMSVRELITVVRPANELDEWATMGVAEKMQREPNNSRIEKEIVPYYVGTADRFFSSLVVLIYNAEVSYDPLQGITKNLPGAYKSAAKDLGFLTIDGGSLVVLDGQHRLLALEKAFKGEIEGKFSSEVADDEVSVIFIDHESSEKTRRIFNKINRHAKPTGRGDNILTSEDDVCAIVARKLLDVDAPLGQTYRNDKGKSENIVDIKNNTLAIRSTKLTTLSLVYDVAEFILKHHNKISGNKVERQFRPTDDTLDECYEIVEKYWSIVLEKLSPFQEALLDHSLIPGMRVPEHPYSLLFKPATQYSLFMAIINAENLGLTIEESIERVSKIDWSMNNIYWKDIIVRSNGSIDPKMQARENAAQLITYLIAGDKMSSHQKESIKEMYNESKGTKLTPENLPTPV